MHCSSVGEDREPAQPGHKRLLLGTEARYAVCLYEGPSEYRLYVNALIWSGRSDARGARDVDWLRGFVTNQRKSFCFFYFVTLEAENEALRLERKRKTFFFSFYSPFVLLLYEHLKSDQPVFEEEIPVEHLTHKWLNPVNGCTP